MLGRTLIVSATLLLGLAGCSSGGAGAEKKPPSTEGAHPKAGGPSRGGPGQKDPLIGAKKMASSGNTDGAIAETEKVIASRPQLEEAYALLAALLSMKDESEASRDALERGLAALPQSATLLHARGMQKLESEDVAGAVTDLEGAREHSATPNADILADLAYAYLFAKRSKEAEETARAAGELDPSAYAPAFVLGEALLASDRPKEAVPAFQRAVSAAPGEASTKRRLAKAHNLSGQHEEALKILDELIAAAPNEPMLRAEAAGALVNLGRAKDAVGYLEKAIELAPKEKALYVFLEKAQTAAGDKKGAKATQQKLKRWKGP